MGNLLEAPITEKEGHNIEVNSLKVGVAGMQGWRIEMEDAHVAVALGPEDHSLVAVFDGHGGQFAAIYSAENIAAKLQSSADWQRYLQDQSNVTHLGNAMQQTFLGLDEDMRQEAAVERSGCTAVAAVITPHVIVVANAGDSRCVLGTNGETKPMSQDHKPYLDSERSRIENAGGKVSWKRVDGDLAVSRALGDFFYKNRDDLPPQDQKVTAFPDILVHTRVVEDEVLLLACDGVWDVMSNEEAIDTTREILSQGERNIQLIAEELIDTCLEKGSRDNISAALVVLPGATFGEGGGVLARRMARSSDQAEARNTNLMGQTLPEDSDPSVTHAIVPVESSPESTH